MPAGKDYYKILGVDKKASDDEIKSAYRKLAKQYHPDVNKEAGAAEKFKEISEAYTILSDKEKRANYDQFGSADGAGFSGFGGSGGGFSGFNFGGFSGFDDLGDILSGMFGGGFSSSRRASSRVDGEDIIAQLNISFIESVRGVKKSVQISRMAKCEACSGTGAKSNSDIQTCKVCGGTGHVHETQNTMFGRMTTSRTCGACSGTGKIISNPCKECGGKGIKKITEAIEIEIPAGINTGESISYRGKGNAGKNGGNDGDLIITVNVGKHPLLRREGYDLFLDLPVPYLVCMLGGEIEVPCADGKFNLKIPAGTKAGEVIRQKGKGIKYLKRIGNGDLIITIVPEFPNGIDKEDRKALEKLLESQNIKDYEKFKKYQDVLKQL